MTANVKVPSLKTEGLILDEYLPYRLSIASNAVSKLIARAYEDRFGLTIPQWRLMAVLAEKPLTQQAIVARTAMDKVTVSRAAQGLVNRHLVGRADAGVDMTFDFGTLIAHAARTRNLGAGTIIGSGTVSNRDEGGGPGKPIADGGLGYSCIAEVRTVETLLNGEAKTPFLRHGDVVRIEMRDQRRHSIFGAIEQTVAAP